MTSNLKTCWFSGIKIYPERGILYVRNDGRQMLFLNGKTKSLHLKEKSQTKIAWTMAYRKLHKKGQECEILKKKKKTINRRATRSESGTTIRVANSKQMASSLLINESL